MVFLSGRQAIAWQCAMYLACYLTLKTKIFTLFVVKKIIKTSKTRSHFCQLWTIISHHLTKGGGGEGVVLRISSDGDDQMGAKIKTSQNP